MRPVADRIVAAMLVALAVSACAGPRYSEYETAPSPPNPTLQADGPRLQCVPYARDHSGVKIYGDAQTWWDKAAGHFVRGPLPEMGAVMVLADYSGPEHGHLAVVRRLVSAREIRVDHANWLNDGAIYVDDPVADVSTANDWSQVRVWNIRTGKWGARIYPVKGFIGPASLTPDRVARAEGNPEIPQQ